MRHWQWQCPSFVHGLGYLLALPRSRVAHTLGQRLRNSHEQLQWLALCLPQRQRHSGGGGHALPGRWRLLFVFAQRHRPHGERTGLLYGDR